MRGPSLDPLDRLGPARTPRVVALDDLDLAAAPVREPHRHDDHELIWLRAGTAEHLVDGEVVPARAGTVTVIGRGQVHVFRRAAGVRGAVVRFSDALLARGAGRIVTGFAHAGAGGRVIAVPPGEADRLDAVVGALAAEAARPPDRYSADLERDLLGVLLLWLERFEDAAQAERPPAGDPDVQLHRRFAGRLGRRRRRIAHRVGFRDPPYFSRAFKRHTGESPQAHRAGARGGS